MEDIYGDCKSICTNIPTPPPRPEVGGIYVYDICTEMGKFQKKSILDTDKIFWIIHIIDT